MRNWLYAARIAKKLTTAQMGEAYEASQTCYYNLEVGRTRTMTLKQAVTISEVLEIPLAEIIKHEGV